jgi:hypothetical protein
MTIKMSDFTPVANPAPTDSIVGISGGSNALFPVSAVGGGGDPWKTYGTPDWRTDFNSSAGLTGWTVTNASNLNYRPSGGMWVSTSLGASAERSIANAPFIFDLRCRLSRPSGVDAFVRMYIFGADGPGRLFVNDVRQPNGYLGVQWLGVRVPVGTVPWNITESTAQWSLLSQGVTMRCWYDGTTYRFYNSFGDPRQVEQVAAACNEAAATYIGTPIGVGWQLDKGGDNFVLEFAQFQTTNLDKWAGM